MVSYNLQYREPSPTWLFFSVIVFDIGSEIILLFRKYSFVYQKFYIFHVEFGSFNTLNLIIRLTIFGGMPMIFSILEHVI